MTFSDRFKTDCISTFVSDPILQELEQQATGATEFFRKYSGCVFENGLYRLHSISEIRTWTQVCCEGFPDFATRIHCFGVDWLGRQFAIDEGRTSGGQSRVLMLEPGTGEALEIPTTFCDFHHCELVEYTNEALAVAFFERWLKAGGNAPKSGECVGYRIPLFLGGEDEVSNLELTDTEVYWSVCTQLLSRIRPLPDRLPIRNVRLRK